MDIEVLWVSFCVGGEHYCHPVNTIREILRYQVPTPVPGAPEHVSGILNVRGQVVTILSGRSLFALDEGKEDEHWRIITFETAGELHGVTVDSVNEIIRFKQSQIFNNEQSTSGVESHLIKGTVKHGNELLVALDLTSPLQPPKAIDKEKEKEKTTQLG